MKKFLLIDDHEIVRMGIKSLLVSLFSFCEVYEAEDGESAMVSLKARTYDLIISDVRMPNTDIFILLRYILRSIPGAKVLILSMSAENVYARKLLQAGALGFVNKEAGAAELGKAIAMALKNKKYISPRFSDQLADEINVQHDNPFRRLSPKEFAICVHLINLKTVTDISKILQISTSTVGTHKAHVLSKLHVKNIVELSDLGKQYSMVR